MPAWGPRNVADGKIESLGLCALLLFKLLLRFSMSFLLKFGAMCNRFGAKQDAESFFLPPSLAWFFVAHSSGVCTFTHKK